MESHGHHGHEQPGGESLAPCERRHITILIHLSAETITRIRSGSARRYSLAIQSGEILLEEFLEPLGLGQVEAAQLLANFCEIGQPFSEVDVGLGPNLPDPATIRRKVRT
jgi:hypothetical protein